MTLPPNTELHATTSDRYAPILTPEAIAFAVALHREFNPRRKDLLSARITRQQAIDAGARPDFLPETADIRAAAWTIAPLPSNLLDRRVEITGPVDRKMIINALNSGARVFMADFEDSTTTTWENLLDGQLNLSDAVRRTITFTDPATSRHYALNPNPAVLFIRARGWHLEERHLWVDGEPMSGSIFDFALYLVDAKLKHAPIPQDEAPATVPCAISPSPPSLPAPPENPNRRPAEPTSPSSSRSTQPRISTTISVLAGLVYSRAGPSPKVPASAPKTVVSPFR